MTALRISTYQDGSPKTDIAPEILTFLDNFVPNSSTERSVNYVGLVSVEGMLALFLPKGMQAAGERSDARNLYRCVSQYERSLGLGWGSKTNASVSIPSGVKILEDYLASGLYTVQETKWQRSNSGKTNWVKTIRQVKPYLTKSNIPIYTPPISSKHQIASDYLLQIHKAIVSESDEQLSWLISQSGSSIAPDLKNIKMLFSTDKALGLLRNELVKQFDDKKIAKLNLMIDYLEQKKEMGGRSDWRLGTTNFQVLWEQMCASVFGDEKNKYPAPAIPAYIIAGSTSVHPENSPRPDVVFAKEKKIAVVDAKYYDFKKSKPSWGDMVKQFFYAKSFKLKYKDFEVSNIFAVPEIADKSVEKVSVVDGDGRLLEEEFSPIKIVYLNVNKVIDLFTQRKRSKDFRNECFD